MVGHYVKQVKWVGHYIKVTKQLHCKVMRKKKQIHLAIFFQNSASQFFPWRRTSKIFFFPRFPLPPPPCPKSLIVIPEVKLVRWKNIR